MRLLRRSSNGELSLTKDLKAEDTIPPYAILSHTWGEDAEEVDFEEFMNGSGTEKIGYRKIQFCAEQARQDGLQYIWVDTCCINKVRKGELSHAINSMFRWYRDAARCYVYLSDVSAKKVESSQSTWEAAFCSSRWFTRGWTLQELLAPDLVEFFSQEWIKLGDKALLRQQIHEITSIPEPALQGTSLAQFDVEERLSWNLHRHTKLEEDRVYSLLGIFDVYISPFYSEGANRALERLKDEINKRNKCIKDLRTTDPYDDKVRIEDTRGGLLKDSYCWVFNNAEFLEWQDNEQSRLLWIKGDPGTGKTMLLCGIIDELKKSTAGLLSFFFCQATDSRINSATAVLRGLIYLLISQQPSLASHLRKKYDQVGSALFQGANSWVALSDIFISMTEDADLKTSYLVIDALDECVIDLPKLLNLIVRTNRSTARAKWLVSSRNETDIELLLTSIGDEAKLILELKQNAEYVARAVDVYIDYKLSCLWSLKVDSMREQVRDELQYKAKGTFLWVAIMMQELEKPESYDPLVVVKGAPPALHHLYDRMMDRIQQLTERNADICRLLLSTAAVVYRPLFLTEIGSLCGLAGRDTALEDTVRSVVALCGSFLTIRDEQVYLVHQSARDYLSGKMALGALPSQNKIHYGLFSRSLELLSSTLKRDMYNLVKPGFLSSEVRIPNPDLLASSRYSCVYWIDHLCASLQNYDHFKLDDSKVYNFLQKHTLHWLEAMSLLKKIPDAIAATKKLQSMCTESKSITWHQTVYDLLQFIMWGGVLIQEAPLQVYYSALVFAPEKSIIRQQFTSEVPDWIEVRSEIDKEWGSLLQTLEGHTDWVTSVAFSPWGDRLASASCDSTVRLWDAATGRLLQTLEGHTNWVTSVAFSPQGDRLASASYDGTVRLWDAATGQPLQTLEGHTNYVTSVAFSTQGDRLASASYDCTVRLWDAAIGRPLQTLEGHTNWVKSVAFSAQGDRLASASDGGTVRLWDTVTGRPLQTLEGHTNGVTSVAFSPRGDQLASASYDCTVRLWETATGRLQQTLEGHTYWVTSVAFSPQGDRLASTSYDRTVRLWDAATGQSLQTLEGHTNYVTSVAFSTQGDRLASASDDSTVRLWNVAMDQPLQTREGHTNRVTSVAFSPQGDQLASASDDGIVLLWDAATGRLLQTLEGHMNWVKSVAFSPQGDRLASASYDRTVRLWDAATGQPLQTLEGHTNYITSVAFSTQGDQLASASYDGTVRLWDAAMGRPLQTLEGHMSSVRSVAFSPQGDRLASASDDGTVRLWDAATGRPLQTLEGHMNSVTSVAFSPQGDRLASASEDGTVRLWNVGTGWPLQTLESYQNFSEASSAFQEASTKGQWVFYQTEGILLLPSQYELSCSIAYGSVLALGTASGQLLVINFSK